MNNQGYREIFNFNAESLKILNDTLRALWKKVMGHVELKDLSDSTRKVIDSKATSSDVASSISQSAEEIRAEVGAIQVGGANYLLNSGTPVSNAKYNIANYKFSGDFLPKAGETYTIRIWGELKGDRAGFSAYNTNGYLPFGTLKDNGDGTFSLTAKWINERDGYPDYTADPPIQLNIYQFPNGGTGSSIITRIKLEAGSKATDWTQHPEEFRAGTNVVINKDEFSVTTPEFSVNITSEDGAKKMLNINEDGIHAQKIDCPNVAQRYDGPSTLYVNPSATKEQMEAGNYVRGLQDAFDMLNGKQIKALITINLAAGITEYGTKSLRAVSGPYWVRIEGDSSNRATLVGKLDIAYNDCLVRVRYLNVQSALNDKGIFCGGGSRLVQIDNCMVTGKGPASTVNGSENGSSTGIHAEYAANVQVTNCELYDTYRSLYVQTLAQMQSQNNKGNCTIGTNRSHIFISGTAPCASTTWTVSKVAGGQAWVDSGITVNQGSKPSTPTVTTTTKSYTATAADTWAGGGWNIYNNNDDIYQGYTDALGEHRGCVWFNGSTIKTDVGSKSIKQATLTLYQVSGVGRNQPVQVSIEGITVNKGGDKPVGKTEHEYGVIGTTLGVNQATTFTLPANAISHLVSGTIKGFMVRTGETASAKGDDNSANYARFTGSGTNAPVLTVVYA